MKLHYGIKGLLSPGTGNGSPRLRQAVGVFLSGCGLLLNADNRFTGGSTGGLLSNHWHICLTGYDGTISESAVFSSSLEKPERSQYSICQRALEPFICTLCTYLEEKKTTHKHEHVTGDRAPTSSYTTFTQPPTSLSHCRLGRTLCALVARVAS